MPINYLQYINSVCQTENFELNRFLVSGADPSVRQIVGEHIAVSAFSRGLSMFIVDNTAGGSDYSVDLCGYRVMNALNGDVSLCSDLFDINTLKGISRLRSLLADLGFDGSRAMKVVSYITFVKETERRLGNTGPLYIETLEEYGSNMLVEWKLCELVDSGKITEENRQYLLGRYAEVSAAGADFETTLVLLAPFMNGRNPDPSIAVHLPVGDYRTDRAMQKIMSNILVSYIRNHSAGVSVLILDDGIGDRGFIPELLKNLPVHAEVNMLTNDAFSLSDTEINILFNKFPVRIFTRHEDMESCAKIETCCGDFDVVKRSSSTTVDRRLRANSAWDILLGTNRTDTQITCAPTRDPRFRKEYIQALPPRTGIIDAGGNKVIFSF